MPLLARHSALNVALVMHCVPRCLTTVSLGVTELASGHDVALRVTATIDSSVQMLGRALKVSSLSGGEMEGRGESFHGLLPHGAVAIEATTGLKLKGAGAPTRESRGHERSCVQEDFGNFETPLARRRHTREPAK